jgi:hypothetical protein
MKKHRWTITANRCFIERATNRTRIGGSVSWLYETLILMFSFDAVIRL